VLKPQRRDYFVEEQQEQMGIREFAIPELEDAAGTKPTGPGILALDFQPSAGHGYLTDFVFCATIRLTLQVEVNPFRANAHPIVALEAELKPAT
jgi:hypothetical protein